MNFSTVSYFLEGKVGTVLMNRPEKRNALNDVMIHELTDAILALGRNPGCRVVVVTGTEKAFCSGMDLDFLNQISAKTHEENLEDAKALVKLLTTMYTLKKPIIAQVNGSALGGGCGIAAVCDYIFASAEQAKFGAPEVCIGFVPAVILPFLIKRMGEGKAKEFVLQGEVITPQTAKERGLITDVVPDAELHSRVQSFADKLASTTSPYAVGLTKELFSRLNELSFKDSLEFAAGLNAMTRKTEDFKKGINSFLKKEKLEW